MGVGHITGISSYFFAIYFDGSLYCVSLNYKMYINIAREVEQLVSVQWWQKNLVLYILGLLFISLLYAQFTLAS